MPDLLQLVINKQANFMINKEDSLNCDSGCRGFEPHRSPQYNQ